MPLTDYMRRHPHRSVGGSSHTSYLERSFERADEEEMVYWRDAGVIANILTLSESESNPAGLMAHALKGLAKMPADKALSWWRFLWEAGAGNMMDYHSSWLTSHCTNDITVSFLLEKGVSPHQRSRYHIFSSDHTRSTTACLTLLSKTLSAECASYRPPSQDEIKRMWRLLDTLWDCPGWLPDVRHQALILLTRYALKESFDAPLQSRCSDYRDRILKASENVNHWSNHGLKDFALEDSLFYVWFRKLVTLTDKGTSKNKASHRHFMEWSQALLALPRAPLSAVLDGWDPSLTHYAREMNDRAWRLLGSTLEKFAQWGVGPWYIEPLRSSSFPSHHSTPSSSPRTLMGWMTVNPDRGYFDGFPSAVWKGLVASSTHRPPNDEWMGLALKEWLGKSLQVSDSRTHDTLTNLSGFSSDKPNDVWLKQWDFFAEIGNWEMQPLSPAVLKTLQHFSHVLVLLPSEDLSLLMEKWNTWGWIPGCFSKQIPEEDDNHIWVFKDPLLKLWADICQRPSLETFVFSLLKKASSSILLENTMLSFMIGTTHSSRPYRSKFFTRIAEEFPSWKKESSMRVVDHFLRNGEVILTNAVLDAGFLPTPDWYAWSVGVGKRNINIASYLHEDPLKRLMHKECEWMKVAHRLHDTGISWEKGDEFSRPLYAMLNHHDSHPDSLQTLLAAGADIMSMKDVWNHPDLEETPILKTWRAHLFEKKMRLTIDSPPESSCRRPRM